jgi:hypothetical protein
MKNFLAKHLVFHLLLVFAILTLGLTFKVSAQSMGTYYAQTKDVLEREWVGSKVYYPAGVDKRFFLASNTMGPSPSDKSQWRTIDIDRFAWAHNSAEFRHPTPGGLMHGEWFILPTHARESKPVLQLDQGATNNTTLWVYQTQVENSRYAADGQPAQIYCDFIYRLTPFDQQNFGGATTIYTLQYHIYNRDGVDITPPSSSNSIPITYNSYQGYVNTTSEKSNLLRFPNQSPQKYALASLIIPIEPTKDPATTPWKVEIEVIANSGEADIYVRGFRLRSAFAQHLLTGQKDAELLQMFKDSILDPMYGSDSAQVRRAKQIKFITAGGEQLSADGFRALAYIDQKFHNYTLKSYPTAANPDRAAKHILTFITNNGADNIEYQAYRAMYEDQTGKLPPAINEEVGFHF